MQTRRLWPVLEQCRAHRWIMYTTMMMTYSLLGMHSTVHSAHIGLSVETTGLTLWQV